MYSYFLHKSGMKRVSHETAQEAKSQNITYIASRDEERKVLRDNNIKTKDISKYRIDLDPLL